MTLSRRSVLSLGVAMGAFALFPSLAPSFAQDAAIPARPFVAEPVAHPIPRTTRPMRIGVIGSGNIGGTVGELWASAGHQVMFSDRDPALAQAQAKRVAGSRAGTAAEAIAYGEVLFVAVPFGAWPAVAREHGAALKGKIVLDPSNLNVARDGAAAEAALKKAGNTGDAVAAWLPGVRLVRAFNTAGYGEFAKQAARPGAKMAIPLASNDAAALAIAVRLVSDIGFDPVTVPGGLAASAKFETRGPGAGVKTAAELRAAMGL
jgi:predicted dinucleotide-binding enzyme